MLRRYLMLLIFALWMGGFTFYTLIVIPTGGKVLGSERDVGFITQQVTNWLNWIGIPALLVLGWNAIVEGGGIKRLLLGAAWLVMAAAQAGLFLIHPVIDAMLDVSTHKIHGLANFYNWHRLYMAVATLQWMAAMFYLCLALWVWRDTDRTHDQSRRTGLLPDAKLAED